eukprot:2799761-Amphidinium_carterae.1
MNNPITNNKVSVANWLCSSVIFICSFCFLGYRRVNFSSLRSGRGNATSARRAYQREASIRAERLGC